MNYAMIYSADERISTSRSQGMICSERYIFLPMGSPLAINLKILTKLIDQVLKGSSARLYTTHPVFRGFYGDSPSILIGNSHCKQLDSVVTSSYFYLRKSKWSALKLFINLELMS